METAIERAVRVAFPDASVVGEEAVVVDARGFRLDGARSHDARLEAGEVRVRADLPIVDVA